MIEKLCMRQNYDGSCDIIIYIDRLDAEFAYEFLNGKLLHGFLSKAEGAKKIVAVRSIKLVVAGGLILSIPFSQFASKALYESRRYAMSYVYFGSASQQIQNVSLSYNTLNTVSPSYFDINADGTLKISGVSESFILAMHDNGIRVVPFLSNGWDRQSGINALKGMDKLSDGIAQVVETYNLDGINVDLENLTELQRADYTRFIKLLREKIPPGKEVSVAVASNPWGTAKGWQGSYDYRALSEYSDYLFIMTYDEHYSGGSPGAVASLSFVDKSMQYALKNVPKEKIVVGIPFYGRLWSTDGNIKGLGISLNRIQELIKKYPHKVFVDAASGSPVAHITVTDGFTLNGRTIKAGNYAIWYEDADSIKQKLALVGKYGLKGAGNWSAGQETPDVWDYYELWLNGHYFSDISGSFAKDDILRLSADGIIMGVTDTLFSPHTSLTRAQAAVIIARTLNLAEDSGGAGFSDTAGNWAEKEILAAEASGIIKGYDDGTFRPDERVSRAEISAMIARMINASYETRGEPMFKDVSANYWAFNEVTSLAKLNILRGYSDNTFRPGSNVTREEAAAIIERARNINAE